VSSRVLITGAQGFVGRYAVADWLQSEPTATILGIGRSRQLGRSFTHRIEWAGARLRAPLPQELRPILTSPRYRYVRLDLRDRGALADLLREFHPSVILHLAGALRDEPTRRLLSTNVLATESLFESIADAAIEVPTVLLGSTGALYGNVPAERLPIQEEEPPGPCDAYSISKEAAEHLARVLAARYGMPVLCARIFNVVGPGQDERHLCGWLGRQMVAVSRGIQSYLEVGSLNTTRDFVDVRDVAVALRLLALRGMPGLAYNVASGVETPTRQIFDTLVGLAGLEAGLPITPRPARPADCLRSFADVRRLYSVGYQPSFSLRQSLSDVLAYYATTVSDPNRCDRTPAAGTSA
jgi:nucleoside-diphosphate-sugar epimerase